MRSRNEHLGRGDRIVSAMEYVHRARGSAVLLQDPSVAFEVRSVFEALRIVRELENGRAGAF